MIHTDELPKNEGQMQFSLAALEDTRLQPKARVMAEDFAISQRPASPYEINLSGSQILVGLMSALCLVGLLLWGFLRLWLFER